MAQRIDHLKESLVDKVVALAAERLDSVRWTVAERFIRAYYANVAAEDILGRDAESLCASALALLAFALEFGRPEGADRVHHVGEALIECLVLATQRVRIVGRAERERTMASERGRQIVPKTSIIISLFNF